MSAGIENKFFHLSTKYDKEWVRKNSLGENVLYNLESLCEIIHFKPGMEVLDLGCGKAISAIFLAKEFSVNVWAIDPKTCVTENLERIKSMNCEQTVRPLKLDAKNLPFPNSYFDVIISVDSFNYFGTNRGYLDYIARFLKPGGQLGIVDICLTGKSDIGNNEEDSNSEIKENLFFVPTLNWLKGLWNDSESLRVNKSEIVPQNTFIKSEYVKDYINSRRKDIIAEELMEDSDNLINIYRMSAEKLSSDYSDAVSNS